ncbi:MAG: hypothetical protein RIC18_06735 [Hoeflea sp.]|uniref:hypothetical protein n=1 Tax=Hoeflea sp. TaxID=1940281 RepID=UPI0032EF3132
MRIFQTPRKEFGRGSGCLALLLFTAGLLSACSAVNSYSVGENYTSDSTQKAGVYFLAKHLLKVTLSGSGNAATVTVEPEPVQDQSLALEVGMALSPFSDDDIKVTFTGDGRLKSVTAKLSDKSAEIATAIVNLAVRSRSEEQSAASLKELHFDPFDAHSARDANRSLSKNGLCIAVEVKPNLWSPGCERWIKHPSFTTNQEAGAQVPEKLAPGIYYRRPAHRMVRVYRNGALETAKPMLFANATPIYRIDIRRSIFIQRDTTINFDKDGALQDVQVDKPSEALEVAKFPATVLEAFANAATGGVAKARSTALNAEAKRLNSASAVNDALAGSIASGRVDATAASRFGDAGGLKRVDRTAPLSDGERVRCENIGFLSEECLRYYRE